MLPTLVRKEAKALPSQLEFVLLELDEMAAMHGEFCNDETPTDVITFHHGEILICPAVAVEQASHYDQSVEDEVLLYGIHGMLHLSGYLDKSPEDFELMRDTQQRILEAVLSKET